MPRRVRGEDFRWWERHGPRLPAHGIKAQTQRGAFGKTWWAGRWIAALELLVDPGRLTRGRSYARSGQVLNLDVSQKGIAARVQGSQRTPYEVTITFAVLSDATWERVFDGLAAEALYAARLLSGEMPEQIEEVFAGVGATLLPGTRKDMKTTCSCPDVSNPCKHVAAVHLLLGERFDEDPFLMFLLRGRDRDAVLAALRARRSGPPTAEDAATREAEPIAEPPLSAFWSVPADLDEIALKFAFPEADALVVKRLGPPPFVRNQQAFTETMEQMYHAISDYALDIALGDT